MKIQIAHPITSYFDATSQLLRAQGEDFHLTGATSLMEIYESSAQNRQDVYVVDSILLRDEPQETLDRLSSLANMHPTIVMIEESEERLSEQLQANGPVTLLYKRKGYLTALADAIRQSHAEQLKRQEDTARAELLRAEAMRAEAARSEAARIETAKAEAARAEAARIEAATVEAAKIEAERDAAAREDARVETNADSTRSAPESSAVEEGFFICDRRGRFLSANKNLQSMIGYSEEEILELSLADLLNKEEEQALFQGIFSGQDDQEIFPILLHFIDKLGNGHAVSMKIRMLRDESAEKRIIGFRGSVTVVPAGKRESAPFAELVDQGMMVQHVLDLVQMSYSEPLNVLLKRIGEIVCQVFGFQRSTVALLDRRKKAYIKQALIGYRDATGPSTDEKPMEVPQEVVDRLFVDHVPVKIIYYNQETLSADSLRSSTALALQPQLAPLETQWHPRDLVLLRLGDHRGNQFGYISIDEPLPDRTPARSTFYNLELFSQMMAMIIENYYRYSTVDRRSRRLKQILINSNIFKLYLSLNELLKEVVWSIKFSLEFNMVSLVLISKKTGQLETKAVACEDKIKLGQISELAYDLKDFSALLREEYRRGKSYLISSEEKVLQHLKQIYYGSLSNGHYIDGWPRYALLLVPIKSREGKIIGFVLADDPADGRLPTTENVHILEILANQVAIAIDNRMLYVQAKDKPQAAVVVPEQAIDPPVADFPDENSSGLRRLVDRFLR